MIVIIKQAPSFLCNDNHGSNRVRIDYQKHAQKAPSLPHSKPKWYSYPTAPVECGCRATWSELGDISEGEKRTVQGDQSRSARPASIANGVPFAAETGEPVPLFGLQEKGWRQTASQFTSDGQCPPIFRHLL